MSFSSLLRQPGPDCPEEALTGDRVLDEYLRDLDARLLGSKWVRWVTLDTAREQLVLYKQRHEFDGHNSDEASRRAVEQAGDVSVRAARQHRLLWKRFAKAAMPWAIAGLTYLVVFVLSFFDPSPVLRLGLCYGGWMFFYALMIGTRKAFICPSRVPQDIKSEGAAGPEFTVELPDEIKSYVPPWLKTYVWITFVVMFSYSAYLVGWPDSLADAKWLVIAIAIPAAIIIACGLLMRRAPTDLGYHYVVGSKGFCIHSPDVFRPRQWVDWCDVMEVGIPEGAKPPTRSYLANPVGAIKCRTRRGKLIAVVVFANMANGERFLRLAEEKIALRAATPVVPLPVEPSPA